MCWSRDVTLHFVVLELVCVALLGWRGERWMLIFMAPLVLQEVIQYILWLQVEADEAAGLATRGVCGATNTRWSLVEQIVVIAVTPLVWRTWSRRSIDAWAAAMQKARVASEDCELSGATSQPVDGAAESDGHATSTADGEGASLLPARMGEDDIETSASQMRAALMPPLVPWGFCCACVGVTQFMVATGQWAPFCTIRGPRGGHQLWPFIVPPLPSALDSMLTRAIVHGGLSLFYLTALSAPLGVYRGEVAAADGKYVRGRLPVLLLTMLGPLVIVPLWLAYRSNERRAGFRTILDCAPHHAPHHAPHAAVPCPRPQCMRPPLALTPKPFCASFACGRRKPCRLSCGLCS